MQNYLPPSFNDDQRLTKLQEVLPEVDKMYSQYAETNHSPGYAYGIILDGKLIQTGSGGYADLDKKIPATPQTMFRIASMTKSFTAMAILKLRDEGKLRLDDPVSMYIPELGNQRLTQDSPPITIRDLLTHAAGFPTDDPWGDRKLDITDEELRQLIKNGISFANPSEIQFEYSNLGYAILGSIINKVSGMPYQQYILQNITKPLGMELIYWNYKDIPTSNLALGYKWIEDKYVQEPMLSDGIFGAMGGMITSIENFVPYIILHMDAWPPRNDKETGPIKRSSIREMQQPWRFRELLIKNNPDGEQKISSEGYGYGLFWSKEQSGKVYGGHSGGLPGFGSNWIFMPEYGLAVVFFTNSTYSPTSNVNHQVIDKIIEGAELKPRKIQPDPILKMKKEELLNVLPDWEAAKLNGIFAGNFFLDNSVEILRKETQRLFSKAGKPIVAEELVPNTQLRGYFILKGEVSDLKVNFGLSPDNPPLIQEFKIEELQKSQKSK